MNRSIAFRLLFSSVIAISIVILLINITSYVRQANDIKTEEEELVSLLENRLSKVLSNDLWNFDYDNVTNVIQSEVDSQLISSIKVLDSDGQLVASAGEAEVESNRQLEIKLTYEPRDNIYVGETIIFIDRSKYNELASQLLINIILELFISIGTVVLTLYFVTKKYIVTPLNKLETAMNRIAQDDADLSKRLPVYNGDDEISRVSSGFNEIITKISQLVEEVSEQNDTLREKYDQINSMQEMLVESEKMASLGSLVAGVAHEINTPVGVGITASTNTLSIIKECQKGLEDRSINLTDLVAKIGTIKKGTDLTYANLERVSSLVTSFKQVAVDQSIQEYRDIELASYIGELYHSISLGYKSKPVTLENNIDPDLKYKTEPGSFAQIFSNLFVNALIHAYQEQTPGVIKLDAQLDGQFVVFTVEDDGAGMDEETKAKLFDPFFTTKRNEGGTGLGMNIVFNLINHKLNGFVEVDSEVGRGTIFTIKLPVIQ